MVTKSWAVAPNNYGKISDAINEVQAYTRQREIGLTDVVATVEEVEAHLDCLLPRKWWPGIEVVYNPWAVPRNYRYVPTGTVFTLLRTTTSWRVGGIERVPVPKYRGGDKPWSWKVVAPPAVWDDEGGKSMLFSMIHRAGWDLPPMPERSESQSQGALEGAEADAA